VPVGVAADPIKPGPVKPGEPVYPVKTGVYYICSGYDKYMTYTGGTTVTMSNYTGNQNQQWNVMVHYSDEYAYIYPVNAPNLILGVPSYPTLGKTIGVYSGSTAVEVYFDKRDNGHYSLGLNYTIPNVPALYHDSSTNQVKGEMFPTGSPTHYAFDWHFEPVIQERSYRIMSRHNGQFLKCNGTTGQVMGVAPSNINDAAQKMAYKLSAKPQRLRLDENCQRYQHRPQHPVLSAWHVNGMEDRYL